MVILLNNIEVKRNKIRRNKFLDMKLRSFLLLVGVVVLMPFTSCDDEKSYADLLKDERRAVNAYLSNFRVVNEIPSDTIFDYGEDAPFYKLDPDGNVYMQVIEPDSKENRPEPDQTVYFRFMRLDLLSLYTDGKEYWSGNKENMFADPTFFLYENYTLDSSAQYGYGLQLPMKFVGINSTVNLLVKSQYGFTDEISYVVPFLYSITYYPSMIGGGSESGEE